MKTINEVFNDCKIDSNILNCELKNIKLYKRTNTIQLDICSKEEILLKELDSFENYLSKRFQVGNIEVEIEYKNKIEEKAIQNNWKNLIQYMARKYPLSRIILKDSNIQINENNITVMLSVSGADFLIARGFNKTLEKLIYQLYGKKYNITFREEIKN